MASKVKQFAESRKLRHWSIAIAGWTFAYAVFQLIIFGILFHRNMKNGQALEVLGIFKLVKLVADALLLIASLSLMFGVFMYCKCMIWFWVPPALVSVAATTGICVLWFGAETATLLVAFEWITILLNAFCIVVVLMRLVQMHRQNCRKPTVSGDINQEPVPLN